MVLEPSKQARLSAPVASVPHATSRGMSWCAASAHALTTEPARGSGRCLPAVGHALIVLLRPNEAPVLAVVRGKAAGAVESSACRQHALLRHVYGAVVLCGFVVAYVLTCAKKARATSMQ